MRVRISVLGLLPVGLATVFVATFLAACGGGGGGGGTTLPPLSDNDLITRSAQEASSTTAQAVSRARAALRGIRSITPQSRGRQSGQCPRVVDVDYQGDYFDGSMLYFDEAVATLDYGNGCSLTGFWTTPFTPSREREYTSVLLRAKLHLLPSTLMLNRMTAIIRWKEKRYCLSEATRYGSPTTPPNSVDLPTAPAPVAPVYRVSGQAPLAFATAESGSRRSCTGVGRGGVVATGSLFCGYTGRRS